MGTGLKNKRALVTGASRGIGRAIALDLAGAGARVCVIARTESDLKKVIQEMGGKAKGHYSIVADLTGKDAAQKIAVDLKKNFGPVDILVNNVGGTIGIRDPFSSVEDWRKIFRINFEVAVEFNNALVPQMKKGARIIHISSLAALEQTATVPYSSAKAALAAYSRGLGKHLEPKGIVVSCILPGAVKGTANKKSLPGKKLLKPQEISRLVLFLCSDTASSFCGSMIPIDGGQSRRFIGT